MSEGNATITVTTNDGGHIDSMVVTVFDDMVACTASGSILMERYNAIEGNLITDLLASTNYPDAPDSVRELDFFMIPSRTGDNYGVRVSGYLCAPETGTYYFWLAGDNYAELYLSSDNTAANASRIAFVHGFTDNEEWSKFASQRSVGIELKEGQSYYIEALLKAGIKGDHLTVAWRKPSNGRGNLPYEVLPGNVLSPRVPASSFSGLDHTNNGNTVMVNMAPNPASEYVNITVTNVEEDAHIGYYLYTLDGKQVGTTFGSTSERIQVSELAKGTYFLKVVHTGGVVTKILLVN